MKWKRGTSGANVEDRRGQSGGGGMGGLGGGIDIGDILGGAAGGGGGRSRGGGIPMGKAGGGLGAILVLVLGVVMTQCQGGGGGGFGGINTPNLTPGAVSEQASPIDPANDPDLDLFEFSKFVFNDSQEYWTGVFSQSNQPYEVAKLVVYTSATSTGCGQGQAAMGPFYCPADQKVYLDLSFVDELSTRFKANGDFALAYVIAHEMGHHIQNVTGIEGEMRKQQQGRDEVEKNKLSIRLELQADCFAGVWSRTALLRQDDASLDAGQLDPNDITEAIDAAAAVGDDAIFKNAGMAIDPDLFNHGTSEQRQRWFSKGYESGDPNKCDTFAVSEGSL
jgi:uncharacterized protein